MAGRPLRSAFWLAVGSLALATFATFGGCKAAETGTEPEPDEAGTDAASTPDVISSGDSAPTDDGAPKITPPNLLKNGEFDQNCANWTAIAGETTLATTARTGAGSCRFCMGTRGEAILEQKIDLTVKSGDKFAAELWIHAAGAPGTLVSAGLLGTSIAISDDVLENAYTSGPAAPEEKWTQVATSFTSNRDRAALWMRLRLQQKGDPADAGGVICVYVDDVALRRAD